MQSLYVLKTCVIPRRVINPSYTKLSTIESEKDGTIIRKSSFKVVNPCEQNVQFVYTDFSMSSLLAVGAGGNLRPVVMSVSSDMSFVDSFTSNITTNVQTSQNA